MTSDSKCQHVQSSHLSLARTHGTCKAQQAAGFVRDQRVWLLQMEPLYRDLTSGHETVESQLGESFAEYLNAEIALRNIVDMEGAKRWLSGTFLFVRVRVSWMT